MVHNNLNDMGFSENVKRNAPDAVKNLKYKHTKKHCLTLIAIIKVEMKIISWISFCTYGTGIHCAEIYIHSLPCTVTYRRERSVREVYEERFLSDRPVSVCERQPDTLLFS